MLIMLKKHFAVVYCILMLPHFVDNLTITIMFDDLPIDQRMA